MTNLPTQAFDELHSLQLKRTDAYTNSDDPDEYRDKIDTLTDKHGYTRLGSGDYRVVYGAENHVVKVAWHKPGVRENRAEYDNWVAAADVEVICAENDQSYIDSTTVDEARAEGEVCPARRYLASIERIADTGGWLIMNRVAASDSNVRVRETDKIRSVLSEQGLYIDEIAPYNVGRVDGRPVIFDYGGT